MDETPGEHDVESQKQRGQVYEVDDELRKSEFGREGTVSAEFPTRPSTVALNDGCKMQTPDYPESRG